MCPHYIFSHVSVLFGPHKFFVVPNHDQNSYSSFLVFYKQYILAGYHGPVNPAGNTTNTPSACRKKRIVGLNTLQIPLMCKIQMLFFTDRDRVYNFYSHYYLHSALTLFPHLLNNFLYCQCGKNILLCMCTFSSAFGPQHMHIGFFYFPTGSWLLFDSLPILYPGVRPPPEPPP